MNSDCSISSIAFDVMRHNNTPIQEMTIWIKDMEPDYEIPSQYSYLARFERFIEGATQVHHSTTSFAPTTGWNTISFNETDFTHEAGKAILVAMRGVCSDVSCGNELLCYQSQCSFRGDWYKVGCNTDPGTNVEGTSYSERAAIQFGYTLTSACASPMGLTVTYPEGIGTEAILGWTENGEATAWQICLNDDETNLIEANSNPFTLTNLTLETTYTAKVRANCGDEQSAWSVAISIVPTFKTMVGIGNASESRLPTNPFQNYSLTQQIYTPAELGDAANIVSIDFFNNGTDATTRNIDIYMTHTLENNCPSWPQGSWIPVAATDLVFSGTVNILSKAWTTIVLDTPFDYDGTQNVVVTVDDNTGSAASYVSEAYQFLCFENQGQTYSSQFYFGTDNHNPTDNTPTAWGTGTNHKNHIRVMKMQPPTGLTVSDVTSQSATLSWTENGTATSWQICIDGDMNNLITVTENPYTLTGLTPNTTYTAKVRANYGIDYNVWSNEVSFITPATLPYSTDFETDCNWIFQKRGEDEVNSWAWGTATSNGGTHSIYVSNDGGASYAYNVTSTSVVMYAHKSFEFEEGCYNISFDWKAVGAIRDHYEGDYLRVLLNPVSNDTPSDLNAPGVICLYNRLRIQDNWQTKSYDLYVSSAQSYRLVFCWISYVGVYTNTWRYGNPAAIDNVSITPIAGLKPTNLQYITSATNTDATLGWTENNSNAIAWQICLNGDEDHPIDANTNPFTLTDLAFDVTYTAKVRTITNFGSTDWSGEISFTPVVGNKPTNLQCTTQGYTATLNWTENNSNAIAWQICLNRDMNNLIQVTENPCTLTDLTSYEVYTAKVRSITSNGITAWSDEISFTTTTPLPYSTDFEDGTDGWTFVKGTVYGYDTYGHQTSWTDQYNDWAWGSAADLNGSHSNSIYISDDDGTHFRFLFHPMPGLLWAYKYFWFEEGVYHISFDWRCYGMYGNESQQLYDYLKVSLNSNSEPSTGGLYTSEPLGQNMLWQPMSFDVTVTTAGRYQLVFLYYASACWIYEQSIGEYAPLPAAIDNVSITPVGGLKPTNLQCTAATNTRATLGWTENNSNATGWQICLNGDEDHLIEASTNPFTLTGLTTEATYYAKVRSITNGDESAWSDEIGFVPTIKTVLGMGTETSVALPLANHFTGVQSQQIYTADELGAAGDILSIGFYKTGTAPCTRNLQIYMAHTTTNKYTTADDWVNTSNAQLIFSGTMSFADDAWTTINLATPFHYDGQQNIAITVLDQTGTAGEQAGFLCYTASEKQTLVYQSLTAYLMNEKSQIRMLKSDKYTTVDGYGTGDGKWQLVASPIVGILDPMESANMLSNTYDLYRFNQSATLEWENWKQEGDNYHFNLESGRGYLYANSENVNLVFSGAPYSDNGQIPLAYDATAHFAGWNLIGNPFATAATIDKPFYRMNEDGTALSAQVEAGNTVEAMEGVFVQATTTGQSANFTASTRSNAKAAKVLQIRVAKANETKGGVSTGSTTATVDNAIIRFDGGQPLGKFTLRTVDSRLYIPQDGKEYAVVTVGDVGTDGVRNVSVGRDAKFCVSTEVPINFKAEENGTYTLNFSAEQVSFSYLHLIDNLTGADVDLLNAGDCGSGSAMTTEGMSYTFTAKTTDDASRFRLVFATSGK